jgi:gas vesicle structural protein
MTVTTTAFRSQRPSNLAEVLDKGIVIDAFVRVSLVGIELLTIDARIVVASVDTYLRFAEAVNRLELQTERPVHVLPGFVEEVTDHMSESKTYGALSGVKHVAEDLIHSARHRRTKTKKKRRSHG